MIELTPESRDEVVVEVLNDTLEALTDNPRPDELLMIAALHRVIGYYTVQK